jgi:hypothetical protein
MAMDRNGNYLFQLHVVQSLRHATDTKESSTSKTVQLLDHLRDKCAKSCKFDYKSYRFRGRKGSSQREVAISEITCYCPDLDSEFLCLVTALGVGDYIKARTNESGLAAVAQRANEHSRQSRWSRMSWRMQGHPEVVTTSLLSLVHLTDRRSQSVIKLLLDRGAKPNKTIRQVGFRKATAWEEFLANAIFHAERRLDDEERDNLTECVSLMMNRGAKISSKTAKRAVKILRDCMSLIYLVVPGELEVDIMRRRGDLLSPDIDAAADVVCELLKNIRRAPEAKFELK